MGGKNENSKKLIERLIQFIDFKEESLNQLAQKIGVSNSYFSKMVRNNGSIGVEILSKIVKYYDDISADWLMTGTGEMLRKPEKQNAREKDVTASVLSQFTENQNKNINITTANSIDSIPLIPVEAMAGYGKDGYQATGYEVRDSYIIPDFEHKGVEYLIRNSGSSMFPKYSNGDILACRPIMDTAFIQWGKVYVLDTEQGPIVKRLFECGNDPDCLECRSENKTDYPPFKIPRSSIRRIAIVVGVIQLE